MTEYTKADYLAACEALFDGKPTEYLSDRWHKWSDTDGQPPSIKWAKKLRWRPVDPTREYKEAFAAGKRVEWRYDNGKVGCDWATVTESHVWDPDCKFTQYRIVEEPKTVRLYPFAYKTSRGVWYPAGFFASLEDAKASYYKDTYVVAPINTDGSIEVSV